MGKLLGIGEALIDFIPEEKGKPIRLVNAFQPKVGGAPANVCGAFRRLGGESAMITQLGTDPFGDKIIQEFQSFGIDCSYVLRTEKANTSLAFVALQEDGNREFSFFRNPGADMLLREEDISEKWFHDVEFLHFCSVSLGEYPMKYAHRRAIEYAQKAGAIISFDPNLRPALWPDQEKLRKTIWEFLPMAHILKISDEELEFISGKKTMAEAKEVLFQGNVQLIIYTAGAKGAEAYTRFARAKTVGAEKEAVDTTGAGDGFIGSFLYQLQEDKIKWDELSGLTEGMLKKYLDFSNQFCGISIGRYGAVASYPTLEETQSSLSCR